MYSNNYSIEDKNIVIATHNQGKVREFKILLSKFQKKVLTSQDLNIQDVEETGETFEENSLIKVKTIPNKFVAIADDSGLCVKSLNGEPGILSARFAEMCGGWYNAMREIYKKVRKKKRSDFSAKFVCCLSLKFKDGKIFSYLGEIGGEITWPPRGSNGFGYDPFFIPDGEKFTYGEIDYQRKILTDHRSVAFEKLAKAHLMSN